MTRNSWSRGWRVAASVIVTLTLPLWFVPAIIVALIYFGVWTFHQILWGESLD
jgi:hypothetical protein